MRDPAQDGRGGDLITIRIKRSHLGALVGLVLGGAGGYALGARAAVSDVPAPAGGQTQAETLAGVASGVAGSPTPAAIVDVDVAGRPSLGPDDAVVTVVEFADYQCPFCSRYARETYPALMDRFGDRIRYVVRNFPLVGRHPHASKAAEAAECAADQDEFWTYRDHLFRNQASLDVESLARFAVELGLDPSAFQDCLDSGRKAEIVSRDVDDGRRYGVRGTPTFFVNGRILIGAHSLRTFEERIRLAELEVRAR